MARTEKDRIDNKIIKAILDEYGGSSRFSYNEKFTDCIVYDDKINPGSILTIELKYDKENSPYIEVGLSDNHGRNIQTDCYEILFGTDLYKKSSRKKGQYTEYLDEKIAYVGQGTRKPRKKLENENRELLKQNCMLMEQNDRIQKNAEQEYLNSRTYIEMQEKIEFLESLVNLNKTAIEDAEARVQKSNSEIVQIYEDNKRLLEHQKDTDYFIGITENWHYAWEYKKLQQEIDRLKGYINAQSVFLIQREDEIKRLHEKVAGLMKELEEDRIIDNSVCVSVEEIEKMIRINKEILKGKGNRRGRKPSMTDETRGIILELHRKGYTIRDIATQTGVSVGWVHETIKRNIQ